MLENLRKRMGREEGFTLIELLVVMLILGILAAIAIPSFLNQRDKAHDADAKAGVRTAQTALETYATDHDGSYASADAAALHAIEATIPATGAEAPTVSGPGGTGSPGTGYRVTVASTTGHTFSIDRAADGTTTYTCTPTTGAGGCPSGGDWPS
jgi:type IV pilus assembly protein PilA